MLPVIALLWSKSGEMSSPSHTGHLRKTKTHTLRVLAHIRQTLHTEQTLLHGLQSVMRKEATPRTTALLPYSAVT